MFVTKTITHKIETENLDNIKCDICGRNLIKGKENNEEISVANLRFSRSTVKLVKASGGFDDPFECESSDFCEKCYKKVLEFLKKMGGKVPSYYYSDDQAEEITKEILEELVS